MEENRDLQEDKQEEKSPLIQKRKQVKVSKKTIFILVLLCAIVGLIYYGVTSFKNEVYNEGFAEGEKQGNQNAAKVVKLDFEDIGELCTQEANMTIVKPYNDSKKMFDIDIPGTNSMAIFSYDVTIKAGLDFSKITYDVDESTKKITVKCPKVKILSNEIDTDSYKLYYEKESVFNNISMDDFNGSLSELRETAEGSAEEKGIYDRAKENAERILKEFFSQNYDLRVYTIEFEEVE